MHTTRELLLEAAADFVRDRLLPLYQKGKQWDSVHRIDWDLEVDPPTCSGCRTSRSPSSARRSGSASSTTARRWVDHAEAIDAEKREQAARRDEVEKSISLADAVIPEQIAT